MTSFDCTSLPGLLGKIETTDWEKVKPWKLKWGHPRGLKGSESSEFPNLAEPHLAVEAVFLNSASLWKSVNALD